MKGLYPPTPCDLPDNWTCLDKGMDYTHNGPAINIRFQHSETGTTSTISIGIIQHDSSHTFQASTDWREDLPAEGLNNKIAIWTDRHNIQYVADSESAVFEVMQPGKVYQINYGYILDSGEYITGCFYIKTVKVDLNLNIIGSLNVFANVSCNFPYKIQYWSDQNPEVITTEESTYCEFQQKIQNLHYMTIYAQVKDMPDTKVELPKIYIPFKYEGLRVDISGTTATINPYLSGNVEGVSYTLTTTHDGASYYRNYDEPVKLDDLNNGMLYTLSINLHYSDATDSTLNYTETLTEHIRTYGLRWSYTVTTNSVMIHLDQTLAGHGQDPNNLTLLPKLTYNKKLHGVMDDWQEFSSDDIEFTALQPDRDYECAICLNGCNDYNDEPDVVELVEFTTLKAVEPDIFVAKVSSHTVIITPRIVAWNESSNLTITASAVCDNPGFATKTQELTITPDSMNIIVLSDLEPGNGYTINLIGLDNFGNKIAIEPIHIVTYGVLPIIPNEFWHSTYIGYRAEYVDGEDSEHHSQDPSKANTIYGYITEADSATPIIYLEGSEAVTEKVLIPNHQYKLYVGITDIADSIIELPFTTKMPAQNVVYEESHTGNTITLSTHYDEGEIDSYQLITTVQVTDLDADEDETDKWECEFEDDIILECLKNGHRYHLVFSATDSDDNTSSTFININTVTLTVLTYKIEIENLETSTRCVKFDIECNQPLPEGQPIMIYLYQLKMDEGIESGQRTERQVIVQRDTVIFDEVAHSTNIKLLAYIADMQDDDELHDTTIWADAKTKRLDTVITSIKRQAPDIIVAEWMATSNGSKLIMDPIAQNTSFAKLDQCYSYDPETDTKLYKLTSDTENNPVKFSEVANLDRCGVSVAISDGYNIVWSPITYKVGLNGTAMICIDNQWRHVIPFISKDNQWHQAKTFISKDNKWHLTS